MQELRFVAVSEDGSYAVLAVPGRSARFTLPIDERLRAVALGQTSRLAQYEIEVESPLRPKEIQARIRSGETVEQIADAAGIPVERVRWFEGPVLAERAYVAEQAQSASVRRPGDSAPGLRLGEIVTDRLRSAGIVPDDAEWDARKRGDGSWQVQLTFPSGGRLHTAEWVFDSRRRHASPDDDSAIKLSLPDEEFTPPGLSAPGEATVTPLAPRLGAVSAAGGGGGGAPARFRQDRTPLAPPPPAPAPAPAPVPVTQPVAVAQPDPDPVPVTEPAVASEASIPQESGVAQEPEVAREAPRKVARETAVAREPVAGRSLAPAPAPEPAATAKPAATPAPTPAESAPPAEVRPAAAPEPAAQPVAQPAAEAKPAARQGRKSARGRRSSVPSWDEIMLGSNRQQD
jgi:hypothetical protein